VQRVLEEESALWAAIEEQNEFVRKWSLVDFSNVTPQIAAELSELAEEFLNEHTGFKHAETLRKQIPWLKAVAGRENSAGERIIDPLLEVLRDPQVSGLFMVLTEDGKRYYSDEAPKSIGNGAFVIKQFDDSTLSTKTTKTYFLDDLKEPTRLGTSYDWTSPQSLFARQASSSLTRIEHSNWEETMLELIDRLIEDERMDPIIQFQLLDNLLPVALEGSVLLQDVLRRPADDIRRTRLGTNLNLFDPEDVDTDKARREAARFLKNLPDMGDILRGIGRMRADITTPLSATGWRWVAWMYKDSNTRQWVCTAPEPPAAGEQGELYIAVKEGSSPDLVKIGSIQDREYRFTEAAQTGLLLEGRPVFQSVSR